MIEVLQLALVNNCVSRSYRLRVMIGIQSDFETGIENGVLSANHPVGSTNSRKRIQSEAQRVGSTNNRKYDSRERQTVP